MSTWAELNLDNEVIRVVISDDYQWLIENLGGTWVNTLGNDLINPGFKYNPIDGGFVQSNVLNIVENPNILFVSPTRSGNQFFSTVLLESFPTVFHYPGGFQPKFYEESDVYDVIVAIIRNPIDSIASSILAFNEATDTEIEYRISETLAMLTSMNTNKDNITIFKFEDITDDPTIALNVISQKLGITALAYDNAKINLLLANSDTQYYPTPIGNDEQLAESKITLSQPQFTDLLTQCTNIYNEIIAAF